MILSISVKQLLFTLLITALSLVTAGFFINKSLHEYHRDSALKETDIHVQNIKKSIERIERKLILEADAIAVEEQIIASVHLVNNYQDILNYNAVLFDQEKKQVGVRILAAVKSGEADEVYVYDRDGDLVTYVSFGNERYTMGIQSYKAGKASLNIIRTDEFQGKQEPIYGDSLDVQIKQNRPTLDGIAYHRDKNGLTVQYTQPITKNRGNGLPERIGTVVLATRLGQEFVRSTVHPPMRFDIFDANYQLVVSSHSERLITSDSLRKVLLHEGLAGDQLYENEHVFFSLAKLQLPDNNSVYLISSYPVSAYQIAAEKTRDAVIMAMLITALFAIPLSLLSLNKFIRRPMARLMDGVEQLRRGDYSTRLEIDTHDELGDLAAAMNLMIRDIKSREDELNTIIDQLPLMLFVKDAKTLKFTNMNSAGVKLLGLPKEAFIGKSDHDFFPAQQADHFVKNDREVLADRTILEIPEESINTPIGERILHTRKVPIYSDSGEAMFLLGVSEDITERKKTDIRLRQWAKAFDSTNDGVMITDLEGEILDVNQAFLGINGYQKNDVIGQNPRLFKSGLHNDDFYKEMWHSIRKEGSWCGEIFNRRRSGEVYPAWETISTVYDDNRDASHFVAVLSDISPIKKTQEKLDYLAHHDPLTGLPNRILLNDRMQHAIDRASRDGIMAAVMFLDLDRFKNINDSLGHPVGDELLLSVSNRLQANLREIDTISRQGGDEFVLIFEDIKEMDNLVDMAGKVLDTFKLPFEVSGREMIVTASLGISLYPNDAQDVTTLIRNADAAMYRAKEHGRNRFWFYTEDITKQAAQRIDIEQALHDTVNHGELLLHYQPQLSLRDQRIVGVEALIRWDRPGYGIVMPDKFIPLAEETGDINTIGEWVIYSACRQMIHWQKNGYFLEHMAINISPVQIRHTDLALIVEEALKKTGLEPCRLELEVTEAIFLQDTEHVGKTLKALDELGVRLALDDFGTGFSSLSYLKDFRFDRLKIDRSFIRNITKESNEQSIANSVIALGHSLNMSVLAEGIEEQGQLDWLIEKGCEVGQGYFFSKPVEEYKVEKLLETAGIKKVKKS
ncbi:MAG: EAL domain-containing protein [Candidatus Thiodiazotropha lotti]|nr:EAL domain-containing protein [Candidatus Thiodiazotropha lotti]MCG8003361.1 EAL domain-containing protein [Candidatus Thiodiazotropha lotti]MCG8008751.1 EAL domain-containing protein [Candidatus Thiodiazotropha lotti]MCW4186983.1 EAL domain-containing protein [Candidatus Thiodiazotropha lotti]MCW4196339.1 EAL domain-containing protein [Candidatus Thiodiazotropha lotti]